MAGREPGRGRSFPDASQSTFLTGESIYKLYIRTIYNCLQILVGLNRYTNLRSCCAKFAAVTPDLYYKLGKYGWRTTHFLMSFATSRLNEPREVERPVIQTMVSVGGTGE